MKLQQKILKQIDGVNEDKKLREDNFARLLDKI